MERILHAIDRGRNGEGIMFFVREGILCKLLKVKFNFKNKESILVELNLPKRKWLIILFTTLIKTPCFAIR